MVETTCEARDVDPIKGEKRTAEAGLKTSNKLLGQWNEIGRRLIANAEDLSADKYDYKANPDSHSFIEQLSTFPGRCIFFRDTAQGKETRMTMIRNAMS